MRLWREKSPQSNVVEQPTVVILPLPKTKPKKPKKIGKLRIALSVKRRFEAHIDKKKSKCWIWQGSRTEDGYGQFWLDEGKVVKAHRFAFEIFVRQLSKKERLRNICNGKSCINPECWEPFVIGSGAAAKLAAKRRLTKSRVVKKR